MIRTSESPEANGLYILGSEAFERVYNSPEILDDIAGSVHILDAPHTAESILKKPELLEKADIIFTGWGAPKMDEDFLAAAPNLKAVFYGAGSVRNMVTDSFWERGIRLTSAVAANAIPVAEFTLSQVLFCLKLGWQNQSLTGHDLLVGPGGYRSTVGLVSLGNIARLVRGFLANHDINVTAYDPFITEEAADKLDVKRCSLNAVFESSDVVSLHTPDLPETRGMIRGEHFASMRHNASFINTARSGVVRHDELIEVLRERTDLWAVLDVLENATSAERAALRELPNVTITPHIAGSTGRECLRMGQYMADELKRYAAGEPMRYELTKERAAMMA